jgi:protein PhnA
MNLTSELQERCGGACELCSESVSLEAYEVQPDNDGSAEKSAMICETCRLQIDSPDTADANHWRCLSDSMWSQVPAVQVLAWRMLYHLKSEGWTQELLESLYLEDDIQSWANAGIVDDNDATAPTLDSNGAKLADGDTVTLIKDLVVKGAGFTAKRGTVVKNISLTSNPEHIEGRVNGTHIVLVAAYLKKAS